MIRVRLMLLMIMTGLIISEALVEGKPRVLYLTNWGVYLAFIIILLQVISAFKYRNCLNNFTLKIN